MHMSAPANRNTIAAIAASGAVAVVILLAAVLLANTKEGTEPRPIERPPIAVNGPVSPPPTVFVTEKGQNDMIRLASPLAGATSAGTLVVEGEARGNWFFEASFPVKLYDADGKLLVAGFAQAEGEWMTSEYVPFGGSYVFEKPATATGTLVLEKDNPSGLPELDDQLRVPVRFAAAPAATGNCRPSGCSGQICADEDSVTTCEYRPEYACYQSAICERQADGACGWRPTATLKTCLSNLE